MPFEPSQQVTVCEFHQSQNNPPSFKEPECSTSKLYDLDPQNSELWVSIELDVRDKLDLLEPPYGLFIYGKTASEVYLNGVSLGKNGQPAFDGTEVAGKLDTVFYIEEDLHSANSHSLVMRLSAQHSLIRLSSPLHLLALGEYGNPKQYIQPYNIFGLIVVGVFAVGALYFLVLSFGSQADTSVRLFACLCLLAGAQLCGELARAFIDYDYPSHDVRLLFVTLCSSLFGLLVLIYSSIKVAGRQSVLWIYVGFLLSTVAIIIVPGFDNKTALGIFVPIVISSLQLLFFWRKQSEKRFLQWFYVQTTVLTIIGFSAAHFHETLYFLIIASFLCYLFVQQAQEQVRNLNQLHIEQTRVAKLEYRLAQNAQYQQSSKIEITMAGHVEWLETRDIGYCKAAGDYAEIYLLNGTEKLYSGTLKQLEELLPETFIRVHRSYLVNVNTVVSLGDDKNGGKANVLVLTSHMQVPVSRRLLPLVRGALKNIMANTAVT